MSGFFQSTGSPLCYAYRAGKQSRQEQRVQIRRLNFASEESCWNWEPDEGYKLTRRMLKRDPSIRALLCMNDRLAFGAYQAASELGLQVPRDIAMVSFDNDEVAAYLRPGLTTIALPHEDMGRMALDLLLGASKPREHLVPMPILMRGSL